MMKIMIVTCFVFALKVSAVQAQDWSCEDSGNLPQQGMNYCAYKDFERADAVLNATWKDVFPKLKAYDAELDANWKGLPSAVLEAQRAWIKFRDAHCTAEGFKFRGGSMEPLIYNSCRANLTRLRTKQIAEILEDG